jgi:putative ABC transport system substrate-binding protein
MREKIFYFALCAMLFAPCLSAEAQQPAKIPKIGWLSPASATVTTRFDSTLREIRALGYVEGKNIVFEYRYADNKIDRLPALADELVRLKVDVLITPGTPATLAAKNATKTIPIVFWGVADPVPTGLVDSLSRPGGNITGITEISEVLAGKRLELLKETVPKLSRVAVLWNPQNPGNAQQWKESQLPARELGLQLHSMEVSSADKYESAFKGAIKARSAALAVAQDALAVSNLKLIADLAIKNRLPAIYTSGNFVDNGGLMSYGPDRAESSKRVAVFVDKILKGTKPADIPVEQPMKFELVTNFKTAKALGLTIPPIVLMRVTRVVK